MSTQTQFAFATAPAAPQMKNCERCAKPCRVAEKANPHADVFVLGTMKTGRYCAECVLVDFFKNCTFGGQPIPPGKEYWDSAEPWPEWRTECGDKDVRFDPETLRGPDERDRLVELLNDFQRYCGAELTAEEIDWDEVIANWHLPFPEKKKRKRGRK